MVTVGEMMQRDFIRLKTDDTISSAIGLLRRSDERYGLVFDSRNKKLYKGMLDRMALVESKLEPHAKIGTFVNHPPTITDDTDAFKAAELMYHAYPCILPVVKRGRVMGVVRARDLILLLQKIPSLARLRCAEVATPNPVTFKYEARMGDVINTMKERRISHAPIVDESGRLLAVFSLTDLYEKYFLSPEGKIQGKAESRGKEAFHSGKVYIADKWFTMDTNVGDMSSILEISASPKELLGRAIKEMYDHKISDIVIVENRMPVGIITTRDLLETFFRARAPEYWGIQFFGEAKLPGILTESVRRQVAEFYEKIKRIYFKDIIYFFVHIKLYEQKETKRKKYSIHLRLAIPAMVFNADQAHFDINTAVSWAIRAMDKELLRFKEKGKKSWTVTGKHGKRQEFGIAKKRILETRGKVIRPKLVKRK